MLPAKINCKHIIDNYYCQQLFLGYNWNLKEKYCTISKSVNEVNSMDKKTPLVTWVKSLYGPGKKFPSGRQLSIESGRNPNVVSDILNSGKGSVETVLAIAEVVDFPKIQALVIAGHLSKKDLSQADIKSNLKPNEIGLLKDFRSLDDALQTAAISQVSALRVLQAGLVDNESSSRKKSPK
jgi:hypothetical protein